MSDAASSKGITLPGRIFTRLTLQHRERKRKCAPGFALADVEEDWDHYHSGIISTTAMQI